MKQYRVVPLAMVRIRMTASFIITWLFQSHWPHFQMPSHTSNRTSLVVLRGGACTFLPSRLPTSLILVGILWVSDMWR